MLCKGIYGELVLKITFRKFHKGTPTDIPLPLLLTVSPVILNAISPPPTSTKFNNSRIKPSLKENLPHFWLSSKTPSVSYLLILLDSVSLPWPEIKNNNNTFFLLNSGSLLIIYSKQQNEQSHSELPLVPTNPTKRMTITETHC